MNHNSKSCVSIHPLADKPYIDPGTSPIVMSGFSEFQSNITIGGTANPAALQHAKMDICALSPVETTHECQAPISATTFKEGGSSGIPLSSALKVLAGFLSQPILFKGALKKIEVIIKNGRGARHYSCISHRLSCPEFHFWVTTSK